MKTEQNTQQNSLRPPSSPLPVAIMGANGYTGRELARLLLRHPYVRLVACLGRQAEWSLSDELMDPRAADVPTLVPKDLPSFLQSKDLPFQTIFLATPPEVSMELAPLFLQAGIVVIDLSGAFRLEREDFEHWYRLSHPCPQLLEQAHYGLSPWSSLRKHQEQFPLISNPGCYATSILMALIPLLRNKIIESEHLVIDAKSGTSGAGLKAKENLLFSEVDGDCRPYKTGCHQHLPEIIKYTKAFTGVDIDPHFSTSLLPIRRGIISAIYARVNSSLLETYQENLPQYILAVLRESYRGHPLVQVGILGESDKKDSKLLSLRQVVGSARTHLSFKVQEGKLYLFSTIDNLLKGAASQAIENWNTYWGLPPETGLLETT